MNKINYNHENYAHQKDISSEHKNVKLVKSVARTIDLLLLFVNTRRYLTLQDISELMDLPKSSTFELVNTMVEKGILELKNTGRKAYGLSLMTYEIGAVAVEDLGVTDIARPYLQELNRLTSGTVFLGVEDRGSIIYVERAEDHSLIKAEAKLGSRRDLHSTSLGKAVLYAHTDEEILQILGPEPYPANTPLTRTTAAQILEDARQSRTRGYSIDDREDTLKMYCIGSVLRNHRNAPIAAISVASLVNLMTDQKKAYIAQKIKETALTISKKLGFSGEFLY